MCELVKREYLNEDKINIVEDIIKKKLDNNPEFVIENISSNGKNFKVIQDGYLLTGTKQRVATLYLSKILDPSIHTISYTGTYNGFGAVAVSYAAHLLNLKCLIFLSQIPISKNPYKVDKKTIYDTRQINTMYALGSEIYLCPDFKLARQKEYDMTMKPGKGWRNNFDGYFNVPLGLNDKDGLMIELLSERLKESNNIITNNSRIWLVAGSGGIMKAIRKAFPDAKMFVLFVGGEKHFNELNNWSKNNDVLLFKDTLNNDNDLPYKSINNYDGRIWKYVKKYGKNNDIIWNIAFD